MNENNPDSIPVAELVPPSQYNYQAPKQPKMGGCLIAALIGFAFLVVSVMVAGFAIFSIVNRNVNQNQFAKQQFPRNGQPVTPGSYFEPTSDFFDAKRVFNAGVDPSPEQRFVDFALALEEACDDTANLEIRELIDYKRYSDRATEYTAIKGSRLIYLPDVIESMRDILVGPLPFSYCKIVNVKKIATNDYAVYSYSLSDYGTLEPVVWWVSDKSGSLKLYDWQQLEFGIRASHETATLSLAQYNGEFSGYERLVELSEEYLAIAEEDSPERMAELTRVLTEFEKLKLPSRVRGSSLFITALRWRAEGENERALDLLSRINQTSVPGVHRLRGDILLDLGQYGKACAAYRSYQSWLGRNPESLAGMWMCHEALGQTDGEFKARLNYIRFTREATIENLSRLMIISNEEQANSLFETISKLPRASSIFSEVVLSIGDSPFAAKRFGWLIDYLENNATHEKVLRYARLKQQIMRGDFTDIPRQLDELQSNEEKKYRRMIWNSLAYHGKVGDVFDRTGSSIEDFKIINALNDNYYEDFQTDEFLKICELATAKNPAQFNILFASGKALNTNGDHAKAAESLVKAKKLIDKETDEFDIDSLNRNLLNAFYRSDQKDEAVKLAKGEGLAEVLISYKTSADDFDGLDELIGSTEFPEHYEYLKCYRDWNKGEKEKAIEAIAKLASLEEDDEGYLGNCEQILLDWCIETGDPARAFELTSSTPIFDELYQDAISKKDFAACENLLKLAVGEISAESELEATAELAWQQKDYAKVLTATELENFAELSSYRTLSLVVKSALRTNQLKIAQRYADLAMTQYLRPHLKAAVLLKQEQYDEAVEFIQNELSYDPVFFMAVPDLRDIDTSVNGPLKDLEPIRLSSYNGRDPHTFQILAKSKTDLNEKLLNDLIRDLVPDADFFQLGANDQWIAIAGELSLAVKQVGDQKGIWNCGKNFEEMHKRFGEASYHIAVRAEWSGISQDDRGYEIAMQLTERLCQPDSLAVQDTSWMTSEEFRLRVKQCVDKSQFFANWPNEYIWGNRREADLANFEFETKLADALEKFVSRSGPLAELNVEVSNRFGEVVEWIPVKVKSSQLGAGFVANFTGEILTDSRISPYLKKGRWIKFNHLQIRKFQLTMEGDTVEASLK